MTTALFTGRAADYAGYRPGYPDALIAALAARLGLGPGTTIADLGAGTGILSRALAATGARVIAIEPNPDMRAAATDAGLALRFQDGTAEATGLGDQSVDHITAAQAFHWFDPPRARAEALRILKPGGQVALVWNKRDKAEGFSSVLETLLLAHCPRYRQDRFPGSLTQAFAQFYVTPPQAPERFANPLTVDRDGLIGYARSFSYVDADNAALFQALDAAFARHAIGGVVTIGQRADLFVGPLTAP